MCFVDYLVLCPVFFGVSAADTSSASTDKSSNENLTIIVVSTICVIAALVALAIVIHNRRRRSQSATYLNRSPQLVLGQSKTASPKLGAEGSIVTFTTPVGLVESPKGSMEHGAPRKCPSSTDSCTTTKTLPRYSETVFQGHRSGMSDEEKIGKVHEQMNPTPGLQSKLAPPGDLLTNPLEEVNRYPSIEGSGVSTVLYETPAPAGTTVLYEIPSSAGTTVQYETPSSAGTTALYDTSSSVCTTDLYQTPLPAGTNALYETPSPAGTSVRKTVSKVIGEQQDGVVGRNEKSGDNAKVPATLTAEGQGSKSCKNTAIQHDSLQEYNYMEMAGLGATMTSHYICHDKPWTFARLRKSLYISCSPTAE